MKVFRRLIPAVVLFTVCLSCNLDDILGTSGGGSSLTEADVVSGLKEALSVGIDTASNHLHKAGGYLLDDAIRIILPEDVSTALDYVENLQEKVQPITSIINLAGINVFDFSVFDGMRDSMMVSMNRAAEMAAPLSVSIFKDAIFSMTIQDGFGILKGDDTAATYYLKTKTFDPLTGVFSPFVDSALSKVGAQQLWQKISLNYNAVTSFYKSIEGLPKTTATAGILPALPFDSLETDLSLYTTQKALNGLFYAVGKQETQIREDPLARVTELLRKVFGSLK